MSLNSSTELVTSVIPGYANDYGGYNWRQLVEKDEASGYRLAQYSVIRAVTR